MKKWCLVFIIILFSSTSFALTLDELAANFAKQPLVRAEFKQTRQIKGMAKPLNASGSMIFSREQGLYWHQLHPFDLMLTLTQTKMTQTVNGQEAQVITAENNPQMFQFNSLLTAIFNADKKVLEDNFTAKIQNTHNGWILTLSPIASPLDKIFNKITLSGNIYVELVELDDKQGDKTTLNFLNQTSSPALSQTELNYFVP